MRIYRTGCRGIPLEIVVNKVYDLRLHFRQEILKDRKK